MILDTVKYSFIVLENNQIIYESASSNPIYSSPVTLRTRELTTFTDVYQTIESTSFDLYYINGNFTFTYASSNNEISLASLKVYYLSTNTKTLLDTETSTSSTSILSSSINTSVNGRYLAEARLTIDGATYLVSSITIIIDEKPESITQDSYWWAALLILTIGLLGISNPALMLVLQGVAILGLSLSGLLPLTETIAVSLMVLLVIIAGLISAKTGGTS
jgi:hypothetical protein